MWRPPLSQEQEVLGDTQGLHWLCWSRQDDLRVSSVWKDVHEERQPEGPPEGSRWTEDQDENLIHLPDMWGEVLW